MAEYKQLNFYMNGVCYDLAADHNYFVCYEKKKPISFSIDGSTYYADEGMKWFQWVSSSYNIDGYYISGQGIYNDSSCYIDNETDGKQIIKNSAYITNSSVYEYVDLGLSVKWATMNVGATGICTYGDYFAWGETDTYYESISQKTWKSGKEGGYYGTPTGAYPYVNDSWQEVSGITQPYNSSTLILNDANDVCKVKMGGSWRMPTQAEVQELVNNTTHAWVTNYQGSGINGRTFTGNGNTLFIPASGYFYGTSRSLAGSYCSLWSSSRNGGRADGAYCLDFYSYDCSVDYYARCYGYAVRGVC